MWVVRGGGARRLYVRRGERKLGRAALGGGLSVSRDHATLRCDDAGELTVEDVGSRYGTFVGDPPKRVAAGERASLRDGDRLRFGPIGDAWTVERERPVVVCFSAARPDATLVAALDELGARVSPDWTDECTHLTMPAATLTLKAVSALARRRPVVTPAYWRARLDAVLADEPPPVEAEFAPPLDEPSVDRSSASVAVDERRERAFAGKRFAFFSDEQVERYRRSIELCGGELVDAYDGEPCTVVVQPERATRAYRDALSRLERAGSRPIPDAEIGLAVLFASTDRYCNAGFSFAARLERRALEDVPRARVLAEDTQRDSDAEPEPPRKLLALSLAPTGPKRRRSADDSDEGGLFEFVRDADERERETSPKRPRLKLRVEAPRDPTRPKPDARAGASTDSDNSRWVSRDELKREPDGDDVDSRLSRLSLRPAVVVVKPELVKRDGSTTTSSSSSARNFKKFSKVSPLNPQASVVRVSVYERSSRRAAPFPDASDSDDDATSFALLCERDSSARYKRTRRL